MKLLYGGKPFRSYLRYTQFNSGEDAWSNVSFGEQSGSLIPTVSSSATDLGRVKTVSKGVCPGSQQAQASQAAIAAISGLIPTIFMTRA
jgi:hypothetical protein